MSEKINVQFKDADLWGGIAQEKVIEDNKQNKEKIDKDTEDKSKVISLVDEIKDKEVPIVSKEAIVEDTKKDNIDNKDKPIIDKKLEEVSQEWFDDEEPNASNVNNKLSDKTTEVWKESPQDKEKQENTNRIVQEYDSILKDPLIASIIEAKKAGKDVLSVIEEIKPVDYKNMSEQQLVDLKFKKLGLDGEDLKDAIDDFNSQPKWKRVEELNNMRTSLNSEQDERLKGYRHSVNANSQKQNEVFKKYEQELNIYSNDLVGKEVNGITITKEIADGVKNNAQTSFFKSLFNEDGSWNAERIFNLSLLDGNIKKIVKTNVDKARNRGKGEILNSITRPDANITNTRKPNENSVGKEEREVNEAQNELFNQGYGRKKTEFLINNKK